MVSLNVDQSKLHVDILAEAIVNEELTIQLKRHKENNGIEEKSIHVHGDVIIDVPTQLGCYFLELHLPLFNYTVATSEDIHVSNQTIYISRPPYLLIKVSPSFFDLISHFLGNESIVLQLVHAINAHRRRHA